MTIFVVFEDVEARVEVFVKHGILILNNVEGRTVGHLIAEKAVVL